jgi:hypothetical protein
MVGIVDQALGPGGQDSLKIASYHEALVDFIKQTDTPMTIGVQGEWGSGKTSLLNQIWSKLEKSNDEHDDDHNYLQIWVNSWEHSLLCTPEECLLKIINEIIVELLNADVDKNKRDAIKEGVQSLMKGALRISSSLAAGNAGAQAVDSLFNNESNTIKKLRQQLKELVQEIKNLETNPYQRVVVYVDDLDRIEPKDAVKILELLKNIFNVPDCVFVLAIDYQVVVKGLKEKFGKPSPENDWEFRAFFDKIIQLPFSMPMASYDIGKYVLSLLENIAYYDSEKDELSEELIEPLVTLSIGTNPRSIKRLINSLSLIKILNDTKNESESGGGSAIDNADVATIMLAMVCLQIANSEIYDMLVAEPKFVDKWDELFAYKITQKKETTIDNSWNENFEQAKKSKDFDESWEQCLYRVCYVNPKQRAKATKYSKFLSVLREKYDPEQFEKYLTTALKETAVTAVSATDKPNIRPPKGSFKPHFNNDYAGWIERKKEDHPNYKDLPKDATSKVFESIIETYKNSFGAVDQESEENKQSQLEHTIKYAGGITFYYKKKKFFGMGIKRNKKGEFIWIECYKNTKDNQMPVNFSSANITFDHSRKLEIEDVENKIINGTSGYVEWMVSTFDPSDVTISENFVEFIVNYSMEGCRQRYDGDKKFVSYMIMNKYLSNFKNKRKDSNDFKEAVDAIESFYNPKNIKTIDL